MKLYNKYKGVIEYLVYPLALLILPLTNYNQGVDVSDSTYSLGNYLFAGRLEGMWVISTYLSNVIGAILMKLPGATTLRGANIYTGLILGIIGLTVYLVLKKEYDARYIFLGEFIALCFCWIPTGILYNYLSYFFMIIGALLLYKGIMKDSGRYYFLAGLVLGINVFVRIPNIMQMALILALWFVCFITGRKWLKSTLICIAGYIIGVAMPAFAVLIKYGFDGIVDMISGLSGITSTDETYTPLSMLVNPIRAYCFSAKWIAVIVIVVVCGIIMFRLMPDRFRIAKTIVYLCAIALMLRFFWGRGMFSFRYYEDYTSMYEWGVIALYLSIIADVFTIIKSVKMRKNESEYSNTDANCISRPALAVISLVIIIIAPLGSNNSLYQNLNNLFLVMPFTVYLIFEWIKKIWTMKNCFSVPVAVMLYSLLACILIQGFGFSQVFVFRDGMRGEKRDTRITGVPSLEGMYTNSYNAESIAGVYNFIQSNCENVEELILFGDCPGMTYILGKPSALFSSWIDLDSNPTELVKEELDLLRENNSDAIVIIRESDGSSVSYDDKLALIYDYIEEGCYSLLYSNESYRIYLR